MGTQKSHAEAEDSQLEIVEAGLLNATPCVTDEGADWLLEVWSDEHDPLEMRGSLRLGARIVHDECRPRAEGSLTRTGGKIESVSGQVRLRDVEIVVEDDCLMVLE